MSRHLDRALEALDVGLQHAGDIGFGHDNGECVRCQRRACAEGSSWCATCKPEVPSTDVFEQVAAAIPTLQAMGEAWLATVAEMVRTFEPYMPQIRAYLDTPPEERPQPRRPCDCLCPVTHRHTKGVCTGYADTTYRLGNGHEVHMCDTCALTTARACLAGPA